MLDRGKVNQGAFGYYHRLRRVKDYVDRNLAEAISLQKAAEQAGLEKKYFSAFFHAKTGICFSDWLTQLRIRQAMAMLRQRNYSITEVAFAVGYQDLRTFERAFKKCTTMTPTAFKAGVRPC